MTPRSEGQGSQIHTTSRICIRIENLAFKQPFARLGPVKMFCFFGVVQRHPTPRFEKLGPSWRIECKLQTGWLPRPRFAYYHNFNFVQSSLNHSCHLQSFVHQVMFAVDTIVSGPSPFIHGELLTVASKRNYNSATTLSVSHSIESGSTITTGTLI